MTVDESVRLATLSIYIPADQAAICADCGGVFLYANGQCPGCGSKQWVLLEPSPFQAAMQQTDVTEAG